MTDPIKWRTFNAEGNHHKIMNGAFVALMKLFIAREFDFFQVLDTFLEVSGSITNALELICIIFTLAHHQNS
jgi:hypothetical protein